MTHSNAILRTALVAAALLAGLGHDGHRLISPLPRILARHSHRTKLSGRGSRRHGMVRFRGLQLSLPALPFGFRLAVFV